MRIRIRDRIRVRLRCRIRSRCRVLRVRSPAESAASSSRPRAIRSRGPLLRSNAFLSSVIGRVQVLHARSPSPGARTGFCRARDPST